MSSETSKQIKRKTALVSGAAQGIGAAITVALCKEGFNVALVDLPFQEDRAAALIGKIKKLVPEAKCIFIGCDASIREQVFAAVELTYKTFRSFEVIINNAGIAIVKSILEHTEADSAKIWAVNVNSVLWGTQAAAKMFIDLKQDHGKIINACSIAGYREASMLGLYGASKFAVRSLTQTSSKELAQYKITVNSYCPGIVNTPMWDAIDAKICEQTGVASGVPTKGYLDSIALGRLEEPEDITGLVSFLASEKSNYITGQSIIVDGGIVFS